MIRRLLLPAFVLTASLLPAQYAETFVPLVRAEQLNRDEALWLAGSVTGSLPVGTEVGDAAQTLERLIPSLFLRLAPDAPVTVGQFAYLLLQLEETPAGFWYALLPSPFTAYEQLVSVGVVDGTVSSTALVDGPRAAAMARRYLAHAGARGAVGAP